MGPVAECGRDADELVSVIVWRTSRLEEAGYPLKLAVKLAHEHVSVDLHVAVGLVASGCPAEVAAQILL